jgi:hypothetical protein
MTPLSMTTLLTRGRRESPSSFAQGVLEAEREEDRPEGRPSR